MTLPALLDATKSVAHLTEVEATGLLPLCYGVCAADVVICQPGFSDGHIARRTMAFCRPAAKGRSTVAHS